MPLSDFSPVNYPQLFQAKKAQLSEQLLPFYQAELASFQSPIQHFRMRAEFRFWHEGDEDGYYAMFDKHDKTKLIRIDNFPIASEAINQLMPKLREKVLASALLKERLFQVEFLSTLSGECLVTLIYHKPLNEDWLAEAKALETSLNCMIIGRSRKQKEVLSREYVNECLNINDKNYSYRQYEGSFTQPNATVNQSMIAWAMACIGKPCDSDLLELYCGNGNFTIPLSSLFRQALATEISKTSVYSAQYNLASNQVSNTRIIRLSSEEFTQALNKEREFNRLKQAKIDLDDYQFSTVLVDPPRAGLDDKTLALISRFDRIIYISCNPQTLVNNLESLNKTHQVTQAAFFDQFPYTNHSEAGVYLEKRTN